MSSMHASTSTQATALTEHRDDPELLMFQRQLHRYAEEGDCAYVRALGTLYKKLVEERLRQLTALRHAGL